MTSNEKCKLIEEIDRELMDYAQHAADVVQSGKLGKVHTVRVHHMLNNRLRLTNMPVIPVTVLVTNIADSSPDHPFINKGKMRLKP